MLTSAGDGQHNRLAILVLQKVCGRNTVADSLDASSHDSELYGRDVNTRALSFLQVWQY